MLIPQDAMAAGSYTIATTPGTSGALADSDDEVRQTGQTMLHHLQCHERSYKIVILPATLRS
jgi:hypothetical protein